MLTRLASFTCVEIVRVGLCGTVDCYWNLGLNLWGIELGVEFVVAEELPQGASWISISFAELIISTWDWSGSQSILDCHVTEF